MVKDKMISFLQNYASASLLKVRTATDPGTRHRATVNYNCTVEKIVGLKAATNYYLDVRQIEVFKDARFRPTEFPPLVAPAIIPASTSPAGYQFPPRRTKSLSSSAGE
jgi:hypothetical protein